MPPEAAWETIRRFIQPDPAAASKEVRRRLNKAPFYSPDHVSAGRADEKATLTGKTPVFRLARHS